MNITEISQIVSTVGFPIAACVVMFYQNGKLQQTLTDFVATLQKMNDRMDSIEDKLEVNYKQLNEGSKTNEI